jgi:uncharacterized protein YlxP (DUF503 family)
LIIGAAVVELHVRGAQSLKAKRGVVRTLVARLRNRFNLSVAEVGGQDTWQRAVLGIAAAGSDRVFVRRQLERAVEFIDDQHLAERLSADFEIADLPYAEGPDPEDADEEED